MMDSGKFSIYVISTIALAVVGIIAVGLSFAAMFLEGRGSTFGNILLLLSFIMPGIGAYIIVKRFEVVWWYPAIAVVSPGLVWIIYGVIKPHTNPSILFVPIIILLILMLPSGWFGYVKRHKVPNKSLKSGTPQSGAP